MVHLGELTVGSVSGMIAAAIFFGGLHSLATHFSGDSSGQD